MSNEDEVRQSRRLLLATLMRQVRNDTYPSTTTLTMIEEILEPQDIPIYAEILIEHVARDRFPSISMIQRIQRVTAA